MNYDELLFRVPHDSMTVLLHKKQQEEEKRREKEALQRQLMAEIDLEWEESEKKLEAETKESKEAAAKKAAAEIEAEKRRWQEKVKEQREQEEAKAREEAKILEEAEKKAKAAFEEEERKRIDEAKKDEQVVQEDKIEEPKEEEKTPEAEPKIDAQTTKEGSESKTETESPQKVFRNNFRHSLCTSRLFLKAGGVKGRRGLAARWEEAVAPTKESAASRSQPMHVHVAMMHFNFDILGKNVKRRWKDDEYVFVLGWGGIPLSIGVLALARRSGDTAAAAGI